MPMAAGLNALRVPAVDIATSSQGTGIVVWFDTLSQKGLNTFGGEDALEDGTEMPSTTTSPTAVRTSRLGIDKDIGGPDA